MPRTCTVCTHPQREVIDQALIDGEPLRAIAGRFGTSRTALQRHKGAHLPAALVKAHEVQEVARGDDLLARLRELHDKAQSLLAKAEVAGDFRTALQGIAQVRGCLELAARVMGLLVERREHTGEGGGPIKVEYVGDWRSG